MMKYALNHPWKFRDWVKAYWIGLWALLVMFSVEAVNLALLNTNTNVMDILMNFLALIIIAEFDESFFLTTAGEPIAQLINDGKLECYKKEKKGEQEKNELGDPEMKDEKNEPEPIVIELENVLKRQVTSSKDARASIIQHEFDFINRDENSEEGKDEN